MGKLITRKGKKKCLDCFKNSYIFEKVIVGLVLKKRQKVSKLIEADIHKNLTKQRKTLKHLL